ncbi:MAG TPA: Ycf66 family protein [Nostocaceae cyanobacterium]|nr:Ycf66 family protein [Nostocaceae cyanobacterium]
MLNFGLNSASVLAQVNLGLNSASILGIFLAVSGAALYFLRSVRPELSRDQDIFFAAVGLLCGFILIFQGWRLDPILQFGQLLLVGSTVFFAVESIRLRGIATQQAKRNTPIVDEERPVSDRYGYSPRRKYEAEMDADLEPLPYYEEEEEEERPPARRRIPGSREERPNRESRNYYEEQPPRRESRNREKPETSDRKRRSSSNRVNRPRDNYDEESWGSPTREVDSWDNSEEEARRTTRRNNRTPRIEPPQDEVAPRPRKRRPPVESSNRQREDDDAIPTDYVPYNPIEKPDSEPDNPSNYDDNV